MKLAGSLAPTLVFGFAVHVAVALIGILVVPIYLRLLGADGYGLVGFYVVLQSWMLLFDLGLSPAVARQLSRYTAGAVEAGEAASLLRAAEALFLISGMAAGAVFFIGSGWVARHWLGASRLPAHEVDLALKMVGGLLVFRWMAGLYQTALIGLERQIPVNSVTLGGVLARSGATVAALIFVSRSPVTFFAVQMAGTLVEAAASRVLLAMAAPRATRGQPAGWSLLSNELRFAGGLALSAAVATLINQADKLALSHALPLGDFGVFSLVVSICTGITLVVPPFVQAFQPRLTTLLAQGRRAEFTHVYRLSGALIVALAAGLAGTIAAQPEMVVFGWTGHRDLALRLAPVLSLYALGTGVGAFLFVPFLLQYAQGLIRLHVIGNLLFGAIWVPTTVWAAFAFGPLGTGVTWLVGNLLFALVWVPFIHRRLLSRDERRGLGLGTLWRVALLGGVLAATRLIDPGAVGRLGALALLAAIAATILALGVFASRELRDEVSRLVKSVLGPAQ